MAGFERWRSQSASETSASITCTTPAIVVLVEFAPSPWLLCNQSRRPRPPESRAQRIRAFANIFDPAMIWTGRWM